ncbi:MAG: ThiF family adenylyltransferase [Calothrix sp. FI2-JRJ7]|jgi:molybdopterin/thiamine biosynthesis adenylyltransferase|nr:ThiF family adenylyltransferase [Calothrix sp. FI2-JRJ7]
MNDIWFFRDFQRLAVEREAILNLQESVNWLTGTNWLIDNAKLCLEAIIHVHGHDYAVKLVYPTLFPTVPPTVYPQNPDETWSTHQYLSGALCLEWRPDTWHPDVTGAQVLESAYKLLEIENPHDTLNHTVATTEHNLSIGQTLRSSYGRFCTHKELTNYLAQLPNSADGSIEFSVQWQNSSFLILIQKIRVNNEVEYSDTLIPQGLRGTTDNHKLEIGAFYKTDIAQEPFEEITTLSSLESLLQTAGFETTALIKEKEIGETKEASRLLGILVADNVGTLHFFFLFSADSEKILKLAQVESCIDSNNPRLPAELRTLPEKKVGIVGLGSTGSKIAASLARSGVGKFYLIDEDIFLPENVCRNDLDWRNVGEHKVNAVQEIISYISSFAQFEVSIINLGGQESSAYLDSILRKLSQCDILIDATANPRVFNLLAFVAKTFALPLVWGEVFAGGIGCMIARSRPGKDINPTNMRSAYYQFISEQSVSFLNSETHQYTWETSDGEIIAATDAEVSIFAAHLTRFIVDTLILREPSLFPQSMYLIGLQSAWIFKAPFHTIPIKTDHLLPQTTNDLTSTPSLSSEMILENINFLKKLLEEIIDGNLPT